MNRKEFIKWYDENGVSKEKKSCNGIDWVIVVMKDGWYALFEYNISNGCYIPVIQAADEKHALDYIFMRERPNVPIQAIC